jgi:hypothetical protein
MTAFSAIPEALGNDKKTGERRRCGTSPEDEPAHSSAGEPGARRAILALGWK